jgi:beta-hydroxylase
MLEQLLAPKWIILGIFIASAICIHYRGRVRHSFLRQLTDHSTLLAPFNVIMYACSKVPNKPFVDAAAFPQLAPLRENWQTIRDEGIALLSDGHIRASTGHNDIGFHSFFKVGYKRFYVKWYGEPPPSARRFAPKTTALVEAIPGMSAALFAVLPPGAKLGAHRDPYAGSLRYHLGLVTPNSDNCYIEVDGERHGWRDGEGVVFDETYVHTAVNNSDVTRIILFCDIERPLSPRPIAWLNRAFRSVFIRASQTQNVEGEKVGIVNRIFGCVYRVRLFGKWVKGKNLFAYHLLKWLLIGGIVYLIFR